jgi:hypothetical protein
MTNYTLNFDEFNLKLEYPDFPENNDDTEFDCFYFEDLKNSFKELLPEVTLFLGSVEIDVDGDMTTWKVDDSYFLIPYPDDNFDWALVRLSWDDNWEKFVWLYDARLKGYKNQANIAATTLLNKLFNRWEINIEDPENDAFKNLLIRQNNNNNNTPILG